VIEEPTMTTTEVTAEDKDFYPAHITIDDLLMLLRNYTRLEQAAARMFRRWADEADEPADKKMLLEIGQIEQDQASAIALHMKELGAVMTDGDVPLTDAIEKYLAQIDSLPTLGERLRFNHTVMSTLERPIVMRVLLEYTAQSTQDLFSKILDNEDYILGWCDRRATELGVDEVDVDKYFAGVMAEA
jgi:hypothetical protein